MGNLNGPRACPPLWHALDRAILLLSRVGRCAPLDAIMAPDEVPRQVWVVEMPVAQGRRGPASTSIHTTLLGAKLSRVSSKVSAASGVANLPPPPSIASRQARLGRAARARLTVDGPCRQIELIPGDCMPREAAEQPSLATAQRRKSDEGQGTGEPRPRVGLRRRPTLHRRPRGFSTSPCCSRLRLQVP